jgi:hypothetical protein
MTRHDYPGIRMHLGYYGPPVAQEPLAQMKPHPAEQQPASASEEIVAAGPPRRSRVKISTDVNR